MQVRSSLVLLVDLTATASAPLDRALQSAGHRVESVTGPAMVADYSARVAGPMCVITGMSSVDPAGVQKIRRLRAASAGAPVIIVAAYADVGTAVAAMKAGAFDVVVEPVDRERVVALVARALNADAEALERQQRLGDVRRNYARLTARERDVLYAVTDGMLNKQAADRLGITEKTIKVHRASVMKKMGAESLPALVRMVDAHRESCERAHPLAVGGGGGGGAELAAFGANHSGGWMLNAG